MQALTVFLLMSSTAILGFLAGNAENRPTQNTLKYVRERAERSNFISPARDVTGREVWIWGDNLTLDDKYAQERESFEGATVWVIK